MTTCAKICSSQKIFVAYNLLYDEELVFPRLGCQKKGFGPPNSENEAAIPKQAQRADRCARVKILAFVSYYIFEYLGFFEF